MCAHDQADGDDLPDFWWSQENDQYPAEEEMPQEGAEDGRFQAILERHVEIHRKALDRERELRNRIERKRKRFLDQVRDAARPVKSWDVCALLKSVLSSDNPQTVSLATDALELIARIAVATGKERGRLVLSLMQRLQSWTYDASGFDRDQLQAASILARRCYLPHPHNEPGRGSEPMG